MISINRLEEISMNALPALKTVFHDGWVLRFADGYTRRANSVNPLYSGSLDIAEKITYCEKSFKDQGIPLNFKITKGSKPPELDRTLESLGFVKMDETKIMTIPLERLSAANPGNITINESLTETWIDSYSAFMGLSEYKRRTFNNMLGKITLPSGYALLTIDGSVAGCGLTVIEEDFAGFFDIHIGKDLRRMGYGRKLMLSLVSFACQKGAKTGYLQVLGSNTPAVNLYSGMGFQEYYSYWYRARPCLPSTNC